MEELVIRELVERIAKAELDRASWKARATSAEQALRTVLAAQEAEEEEDAPDE